MRQLLLQGLQNPITRRLFVGGSWIVLGALLSRALSLVATIAIARTLETERFGEYLIIQSTIGMLGVLGGAGLGVVATKFAAELRERDDARLGGILSLLNHGSWLSGALIAMSSALILPLVAPTVIGVDALATPLALASLSLFFLTLDGYHTSVLMGLEAAKETMYCTLVSAALSAALISAGSWQLGLTGAVYGMIVASALQAGFSRWRLDRILRERAIRYHRAYGKELHVLWRYAAPAFLGSAMVAPVHWICQMLLANSPNGVREVATLGVGLQWFQAVHFLPLSFGRIALPIITNLLAGNGARDSRKLLVHAVLANVVASLPIALIVAAASDRIIGLYAIDTAHAGSAVALMAFAATVSSACVPVGQVMVARGKVWQAWLMNLGWAIAFIGASHLLLAYGAPGVAAGLLTAYILHTTWVFMWVWKSLSTDAHPQSTTPPR